MYSIMLHQSEHCLTSRVFPMTFTITVYFTEIIYVICIKVESIFYEFDFINFLTLEGFMNYRNFVSYLINHVNKYKVGLVATKVVGCFSSMQTKLSV